MKLIAAVSLRAESKQRVHVRCEVKHTTLAGVTHNAPHSFKIGDKFGRNVRKFDLFHFPGPEKKTLCLFPFSGSRN